MAVLRSFPECRKGRVAADRKTRLRFESYPSCLLPGMMYLLYIYGSPLALAPDASWKISNGNPRIGRCAYRALWFEIRSRSGNQRPVYVDYVDWSGLPRLSFAARCRWEMCDELGFNAVVMLVPDGFRLSLSQDRGTGHSFRGRAIGEL